MSFTKEEYQSILNVLHRAEVKGVNEANALLALFTKVKDHLDGLTSETPKVD